MRGSIMSSKSKGYSLFGNCRKILYSPHEHDRKDAESQNLQNAKDSDYRVIMFHDRILVLEKVPGSILKNTAILI
jgi:hypothetical protein